MLNGEDGFSKGELIGKCLFGHDGWEKQKHRVPGLTIPGTKEQNMSHTPVPSLQERLRKLAGDRHLYVP